MIPLPPDLLYLIPLVSLLISLVSIPLIIFVSARKKLFDIPDNDRKLHSQTVPNLGGIGIFFAYLVTCLLFIEPDTFKTWKYLIASSLLLFLTGIIDDLMALKPSQKILAQLIASAITVYFADIRLVSLHGILGVQELPYWFSIGFSVIGCVFVTNAFNLIDGIDGLAGSIGVLSTFILGICLAVIGNMTGACLAFALMGSVIGFLKYNIAPAKVFMGDTGSMLIGFTVAVLCIVFVNSFNQDVNINQSMLLHSPHAALIISLSVLSIPVFDSFRVFIIRILKGTSPFKADRRHIHYYLLDSGFTQTRSVIIIIAANILIIAVSFLIQDYNPNIGIASVTGLSMVLFIVVYRMRKTKNGNQSSNNTLPEKNA